MKQLALTKQSSENEIKAYFQKVLELKQSGEEFPIDLELVWPLAYAEKGKAVRALRSNFIESEDFKVFAQNGQNSTVGRPIDGYFLSVSCLEYFIARKVRPVFEVYRRVFHRVAEQKLLSPAEQLLYQAQLMVEQERRVSLIEAKVEAIDARTQTRPDYFTIVGYGCLNGISVNLRMASRLGRNASTICKRQGIVPDEIPDPRFGKVKMYPRKVLDEVFTQTL